MTQLQQLLCAAVLPLFLALVPCTGVAASAFLDEAAVAAELDCLCDEAEGFIGLFLSSLRGPQVERVS